MAALGSALDARSRRGTWLVRMEDVDSPRVLPGCADEILRTLEIFGFEWDGPVLYQSTRTDAYAAALASLRELRLTFECSCSRALLHDDAEDSAYPGTCHAGPTRPGPTATRFRIDARTTERFEDRIRGPCQIALGRLGDVVVRRKDNLFAYQLAVVVDDEAQGITDVVRGADLLDSTAWQRALQRALRYGTPTYGHLPLITEPDGAKLGKSRHSLPLDPSEVPAALTHALALLGQAPPAALARASRREVWDWALAHWQPGNAAHGPHPPL